MYCCADQKPVTLANGQAIILADITSNITVTNSDNDDSNNNNDNNSNKNSNNNNNNNNSNNNNNNIISGAEDEKVIDFIFFSNNREILKIYPFLLKKNGSYHFDGLSITILSLSKKIDVLKIT